MALVLFVIVAVSLAVAFDVMETLPNESTAELSTRASVFVPITFLANVPP